jgi:hypothetical protein
VLHRSIKIEGVQKMTLNECIDILNDSVNELIGISEILMFADEWARNRGEEMAYYHIIEDTCLRVKNNLNNVSKELIILNSKQND